jgi:TonB family protein
MALSSRVRREPRNGGKVQQSEIAKSSGRPVLDAEALSLIQRAKPPPALPPHFPTRTLDAVVPIEFSLAG